MGFSNSYVERLRKKARGVILPTQEICAILESSFDLSAPHTIADFGAGTLYFSEYFAEKEWLIMRFLWGGGGRN